MNSGLVAQYLGLWAASQRAESETARLEAEINSAEDRAVAATLQEANEQVRAALDTAQVLRVLAVVAGETARTEALIARAAERQADSLRVEAEEQANIARFAQERADTARADAEAQDRGGARDGDWGTL